MNPLLRSFPALFLPLLSSAAFAATFDLTTLGGDLVVSSSTGEEEIVLVQSDPSAPATNRITIASGATAVLRLSGVSIAPTTRPAIAVEPGAELLLRLDGTNILSGGPGYAALSVPRIDGTDARVRIAEGEESGGVLVATGGPGAAGIGGDATRDGGSVRIESGEVRAIAGSGAGIGGGTGGAGGTFVLTGGSVFAQGKAGGAGVGGAGGRLGGVGGAGGAVQISGGALTAVGSPSGAGIGGGNNAAGGTVQISGGTVDAKGGAGAAGIGGGAGEGGNGGDVYVSGGWTHAAGDAVASATSVFSISGAAAVGGGSAGDGGTIVVTGGSLLGEPLGVFGDNAWAAGFVSNGAEEVFPVPLPALPDGAAIALENYVYRYAGEGGTNAVCFHLPAGTFDLCADDAGGPRYARLSVAEGGTLAVASGPTLSLAREDGETVLSFSDGWPGLAWVWQTSTNLLDKSGWTDGDNPPEGAARAFWRLRAAE